MKPSLSACIRLAASACLALSAHAGAALIHVEARADVENTPHTTAYIPVGTTVSADLSFDAAGTYSAGTYDVSGVSGSFDWNDGTAHTMTAHSAFVAGLGNGGFVSIAFQGDSPIINGFELAWLSVGFFVSVNPITTSVDLGELLAGATLWGYEFAIYGIGQVWARENLSGSVSASVPSPSSLALVGIGSLGLVLRRRRVSHLAAAG